MTPSELGKATNDKELLENDMLQSVTTKKPSFSKHKVLCWL
jgi:hypothetical protein